MSLDNPKLSARNLIQMTRRCGRRHFLTSLSRRQRKPLHKPLFFASSLWCGNTKCEGSINFSSIGSVLYILVAIKAEKSVGIRNNPFLQKLIRNHRYFGYIFANRRELTKRNRPVQTALIGQLANFWTILIIRLYIH